MVRGEERWHKFSVLDKTLVYFNCRLCVCSITFLCKYPSRSFFSSIRQENIMNTKGKTMKMARGRPEPATNKQK
jgi:hypothetical protein